MRSMKELHAIVENQGRLIDYSDDGFQAILKYKTTELSIIASWGLGWDHVSVHAFSPKPKKVYTPSWTQMAWVKDLFFRADEVAFQLHPSKANYINNHEHTLHLWRYQQGDPPMPPRHLI